MDGISSEVGFSGSTETNDDSANYCDRESESVGHREKFSVINISDNEANKNIA